MQPINDLKHVKESLSDLFFDIEKFKKEFYQNFNNLEFIQLKTHLTFFGGNYVTKGQKKLEECINTVNGLMKPYEEKKSSPKGSA